MRTKGFTLVELLVVIAVVGILTGVAVAVLNPVQFFNQGQDGRRISDLGKIQATLELSFADNNQYPDALPAGSPTDPDGGNYEYCVDDATTPMNYVVCATMETTPLPSDCRTAAYGCSKNCCLTNPF